MTPFIPGLRLAELFYGEAVRPVLQRAFPAVPYAAGLLGTGSEVLGYDTSMSTDHNWGPRLLLFLEEHDYTEYAAPLGETLRRDLPHQLHGYPTSFSPTNEEKTLLLEQRSSGPVDHGVTITTVARFLDGRLGIVSWRSMQAIDWLTCGDQALLEVTSGAIFHDDPGQATDCRAALAYYPHDIWLYLLAAQWSRIGQLESFVGRCGDSGDDLGSALVTSTLVRDVMRLGFLMERVYAPYPKWFGTAFARLACAPALVPSLQSALRAASWQEREGHLVAAYEAVAVMHNRLRITAPLPHESSHFHGRPFRVIHGDTFARAIWASITDRAVLSLPPMVGGIDQFADSTEVLSYAAIRARLRAVYGTSAASRIP